MTKSKMNQRQKAKARTIAKTLAAAREEFTTGDYHTVTIRSIAKRMKMTTGAVFANFSGKEQLFTEAMGFPAPVDGPLTRAAPMLLDAALDAVNAYISGEPVHSSVFDQARAAITLATSPLDGEAWARHLSAIRRDEPHTLAAGEAAPSVPSDGAAA